MPISELFVESSRAEKPRIVTLYIYIYPYTSTLNIERQRMERGFFCPFFPYFYNEDITSVVVRRTKASEKLTATSGNIIDLTDGRNVFFFWGEKNCQR